MSPATALVFTLSLLTPAAPTDLCPGPAAGDWRGALSFRGDTWRVELGVAGVDGGIEALLGLPYLTMAEEPIPARCVGHTLAVDLPFGLDTLELSAEDDGLEGSKTLGTDPLRLHLDRIAPSGIRHREVEIHNGPATLVGELVLPPGDGPHPAVVLIHGSEPQGRQSWPYRSWADFFARRGIAALVYDKRGVGEGTGPWMEVTFPDLADLATDAVAAVGLLAAEPAVDTSRIGLAGGSQAAWVALLAAERTDAVSFLILRSAPAGTPAEQELQSVEHRVRAAYGDRAAGRALAHTRLFFSVVETGATGEAWPALRASVAEIGTEPWADLVQRPETPDDLFWWRRNHAVDSRLLARGLTDRTHRSGRYLPSLLLYGAADLTVPPSLNAPVLGTLLPNATVHVFPAADHGLEVPGGTGPDGRWRFPRKAPGLSEAIDAWLDEQGLTPTAPDEDAPAGG